MAMNGGRLQRVKELDERLGTLADPIKVLSALSWPHGVEEEFLTSFRAGTPELPKVTLTPKDHSREIDALEALQAECDREHPLDNLVYKTARSYESAARMLGAIGTPDFSRYSIELYGKPDDPYKNQDFTALDAADYFLERTDDLVGGHVVPPTVASIPAEEFALRLKKAVDEFFVEDQVDVVLDAGLSSKAIAGSKRIRLRAGALFSDLDLDQLLFHEAHVHAATMLNGRRQPNLKLLSLGAPRTTRTQEGLAVLAELLTLSLDVSRLRRLALRVKAIARVLDGADFIEIFRTFLEAGQSEEESYQSTVRCFRGGDVRGGVAFTKDSVYLKGMLEVYAFLMTCVHENRPEFAAALFCGRLTLGDVVELAPYCETGFIAPPRYVPHWARDLRTLTSAFAFNAFLTRADMTHLTFDRFVQFEEAVAEGTLQS
jgi:uncharacterized protein (TIGR02421 family)